MGPKIAMLTEQHKRIVGHVTQGVEVNNQII